jgi:RNA polymerase sigma factor (sigma-70 family)
MKWDSVQERELAEMIAKFSIYIRSYIYKYRVLDYGVDPEDVVQEVRIRLWKALRNENIISKPSSYIKKVVTTVVIDQLRRIRREDIVIIEEKSRRISESDQSYPTCKNLSDFDMSPILESALGKLILSRRTVVKLHLLNMKTDAIATSFNWSLNKTRNLLYRGLSDLKNILKDEQTKK